MTNFDKIIDQTASSDASRGHIDNLFK